MVSITSDGESSTPTIVLSSQSEFSSQQSQIPHSSASSQSQSQSQQNTYPKLETATTTDKPINQVDCALIFQPEPEKQVQSDVDPSNIALPKMLEPLKIPQPSLPIEPSSSSSTTSFNTSLPSSSSTGSTIPIHSASGRRGSLANWKIPHFSDSSKPKLHGRYSNPNSPTMEHPNPVNHNMRPTSSGSRKGKEVIEMTALPVTDTSIVNPLAGKSSPYGPEERSKEDMAMAKWRKWVVEQPIQTVPAEHSPIRSRRTSPASTMLNGPHGGPSPRMSGLSSPRNNMSPKQFSVSGSPLEPVGSAGSSSSSSGGLASRPGFSPTTKTSRLGSASGSGLGEYNEFCNTASVMALRDVELAVDEEVLERNERLKNSTTQNRRMSTQPRISELPNPFADIAQRLGSRRVRPIVLELIQALGHYIDAVWCINYPNRPCPWIIGVNESPVPPSIRRMNMAQNNQSDENQSSQMVWKSPMITAVQNGKGSGHVNAPPTIRDVKFWGDEVTFAIRDVDEVVGIFKGVGWAFGSAMRDGVYGGVSSDNVLGLKGEGGGMTRLLNDLEEAIWGDAQPRPTDLSYDLPIDFDPYAVPDDQELLLASTVPRNGVNGRSGGSGMNSRSALMDFFGESRTTTSTTNTSSGSRTTLPAMEEEIDALPDLIQTSNKKGTDEEDEDEDEERIKSPNLSRGKSSNTIPGVDINDLPTNTNLEELSLEEIGKRRHLEWLENQRSGLNAW